MSARLRSFAQAALAACLVSTSLQARAAAPDCAPIPVVSGGSLQSVSQDMALNGVPMAIQLYKSDKAPEQILAFYRQTWRAQGARPAAIEYDLAPWKVIAAARDGCFYTVQVQAAGRGSSALLGVSRAAGSVPTPGAGFPQMAGSSVRNDYTSNDGGKSGRLLVLSNHYSSNGNAVFYREHLVRAGWTLVRQEAPVVRQAQAVLLVFRRGASWLEMTIKQGQAATELVVNIND